MSENIVGILVLLEFIGVVLGVWYLAKRSVRKEFSESSTVKSFDNSVRTSNKSLKESLKRCSR